MITSHFLNSISKMFCNILLQLNMAKLRYIFSAFSPETEETNSCQKVIRALAFSGREKFGNSFHVNLLGIV